MGTTSLFSEGCSAPFVASTEIRELERRPTCKFQGWQQLIGEAALQRLDTFTF